MTCPDVGYTRGSYFNFTLAFLTRVMFDGSKPTGEMANRLAVSITGSWVCQFALNS